MILCLIYDMSNIDNFLLLLPVKIKNQNKLNLLSQTFIISTSQKYIMTVAWEVSKQRDITQTQPEELKQRH